MIVLKDKKDIKFAPNNFLKDYEWELHGQYDSLQFVNKDVKVLSVQSTKVGEKTYKAFPNLEWIIIRQHGYDNINLNECEKRGIGVVTTKPFAQSTADWIMIPSTCPIVLGNVLDESKLTDCLHFGV